MGYEILEGQISKSEAILNPILFLTASALFLGSSIIEIFHVGAPFYKYCFLILCSFIVGGIGIRLPAQWTFTHTDITIKNIYRRTKTYKYNAIKKAEYRTQRGSPYYLLSFSPLHTYYFAEHEGDKIEKFLKKRG